MFEIVEATKSDLPRLVDMFFESENYHRAHRPDIFKEPSRQQMSGFLEELFENENSMSLVAKVEGEVAGLVRFRKFEAPPIPGFKDRGRWHGVIEDLVVSEQFRRRGIASRLIKKSEEIMKEQGVSHIQLNVYSFNEGAQKLYKKMGYGEMYYRLGKDL